MALQISSPTAGQLQEWDEKTALVVYDPKLAAERLKLARQEVQDAEQPTQPETPKKPKPSARVPGLSATASELANKYEQQRQAEQKAFDAQCKAKREADRQNPQPPSPPKVFIPGFARAEEEDLWGDMEDAMNEQQQSSVPPAPKKRKFKHWRDEQEYEYDGNETGQGGAGMTGDSQSGDYDEDPYKRPAKRMRTEVPHDAIKAWRLQAEKAFQDYPGLEIFPEPPSWPCGSSICEVEAGRLFKACDHNLSAAFEGLTPGELKDQKLMFHTDRFVRCAVDRQPEFQAKAKAVFSAIGNISKTLAQDAQGRREFQAEAEADEAERAAKKAAREQWRRGDGSTGALTRKAMK